MFADVVSLLAAMLATGWLVLAVLAVRSHRGRREGGALLLAVGAAVLLFGGQAVLSDGIDDAGGGATPLDRTVEAFVVGHRTPVLTALAETLNVAGSLAGLTAMALVAVALLLWRHRRVEAAVVLAAPIAAGLLGNGTKLGYDRARPPVAGHLVVVTDSSLPSGHALDATIVLGVLTVVAVSLLRRAGARVAVVVAAGAGIAVAGAARVYLGVHWATDVLAGWLLGGAWVAFSAAVLLMFAGRSAGPRIARRAPAADPARARRSDDSTAAPGTSETRRADDGPGRRDTAA
jgi:undecaprenyl-diphosphatase